LRSNPDLGKNQLRNKSADFTNKNYIFGNYISKATSMPKFRSLAHSCQRITWGLKFPQNFQIMPICKSKFQWVMIGIYSVLEYNKL